MPHAPDADGVGMFAPHCSVISLFVKFVTGPVIWSVCPNVVLPKMHAVATTHIKVFTFIRPLNTEAQYDCKLSTSLAR